MDLSRIEANALATNVRLRCFLKALKYGRYRDLGDHADVAVADVPELSEQDREVILEYWDNGPSQDNSRLIAKAISGVMPHIKEREMG